VILKSIVPYSTNGIRLTRILGVFFYAILFFLCVKSVFNETITLLALAGYETIMANSALHT